MTSIIRANFNRNVGLTEQASDLLKFFTISLLSKICFFILFDSSFEGEELVCEMFFVNIVFFLLTSKNIKNTFYGMINRCVDVMTL